MEVYPLDPTGINPTNLIVDEIIVVNPPAAITDASFVVPRITPFFKEGLEIRHGARELIEDVDYQLVFRSIALSEHFERELFGGIMFINREFSGTLKISYQVLGGDYQTADREFLERMVRHIGAVRWISYDQIYGLPAGFPPAYHMHDLETGLVDMGDVVTVVGQIADAMEHMPQGSIGEVSTRLDNHLLKQYAHTSNQVGLGDVENLPVATTSDIVEGSRKYITADVLKAYTGGNIGGGGGSSFDPTTINNKISNLEGEIKRLEELITKIPTSPTTPTQPAATERLPVGAMFFTSINYSSGAAVSAAMGYGTWERYAQGYAIVGVSASAADPAWTRTMGQTFGSYTHTLTLDQMPAHKHSNHGNYDRFGSRADYSGKETQGSGDYKHMNEEYGTGKMTAQDWLNAQEQSRGGGQAHNNVQPSIVMGCWRRTN